MFTDTSNWREEGPKCLVQSLDILSTEINQVMLWQLLSFMCSDTSYIVGSSHVKPWPLLTNWVITRKWISAIHWHGQKRVKFFVFRYSCQQIVRVFPSGNLCDPISRGARTTSAAAATSVSLRSPLRPLGRQWQWRVNDALAWSAAFQECQDTRATTSYIITMTHGGQHRRPFTATDLEKLLLLFIGFPVSYVFENEYMYIYTWEYYFCL